MQSNELGVEKSLLVRRFKKTLVRIIVIVDDNRLDIRDLLLALYDGKAFGLGFAVLALNAPLDSFEGKSAGGVGLENDGRDAQALDVFNGMLSFSPPRTSDLTTAPKFVELVLGQWGSLSQQQLGVEDLHSVHPDAVFYYEAVMLFGHALDSLLTKCGPSCVRSELSSEIRKQHFMSLSGPVVYKPGAIFRSEAWLMLNVWGAEAVPVYAVDVKTGTFLPLGAPSGASCRRTHALYKPCTSCGRSGSG